MGEPLGLRPSEYDGIYFLPGESDEELIISCWEFKSDTEYSDAKPIEGNQIGNMYHIAFFRKDEEGNPVFDDHYEAILGDPEAYIKNLTGAGLYGCVLKKTEKSGKWFDDYLKRALNYVTVKKLKAYAESIANT
jgi:hypothetical protein